MTSSPLVEQFFRHEYGKVVATLARRVGTRDLQGVEDAVQTALVKALERWRRSGVPRNPSAWLFRVAHNALMSDFRARSGRGRRRHVEGIDVAHEPSEAFLAGEVPDDLLRMLFVCCDETIPLPSRLVLVLKTLCGFGVKEIAQRLFTSEANVYKRLTRARSQLRQAPPRLDGFDDAEIAARLADVHRVLYLIFTEGHLSLHDDAAVRVELCGEAIRLALVLAEHRAGATPQTSALLALMYLNAARIPGRLDAHGALLLLEEQDRTRWDRRAIEQGLSWLARSAEGDTFSRYHAEARIAVEHALAPSFDETRWDQVAGAYALLEHLEPSPLHRLNRAVAVAEWKGPAEALVLLEGRAPPTWLAGSWLWSVVIADLHRRMGHLTQAARHREVAMAGAPTEAVRALLERRSRR